MKQTQKSELRRLAEVVILVGAIVETIGLVLVIILTLGIGAIVAGPILFLLWMARQKAVNENSYGWTIYGIVHGALSGWITLVGYILLLIDKNRHLEE